MDVRNNATSLDLFSRKTPQMRAFHMSWFAFFLCFFAWFGTAPLMAVVREELQLNKDQIFNTIIASLAIFAQVIGGGSLALGFVTRVAEAANAVTLGGARLNSVFGEMFRGLMGSNVAFQFKALTLFSRVLLVWRGSGHFVLDHRWRLERDEEQDLLGA